MVAQRLQQIPRSTLIRFWHASTLGLYRYLYFERL
jgi:hypothetical protein